MSKSKKLKLGIPPWFHKSEMPCPCGSERSFKYCCQPNIDQFSTHSFVDAFNAKNYLLATKIARAHLAEYLSNVYRHTIPALEQKIQLPLPLVAIDINALSELTENLEDCLELQNKSIEALELHKHMKKIVPLPGFDQRLLALRISKLAWSHNKETQAKAELSTFKKTNEIVDVVLLQVYLNLMGDELNFHENIRMVEKIIRKCVEGYRDSSEILHYRVLKALCFYLIGDDAEALRDIDKALKEFHCKELRPYALRVLGMTRKLRWYLSHEEDDLEKSIKLYKKLLGENLTSSGMADVYGELGLLYVLKWELDIGIDFLNLALKYEQDSKVLILKADTLIKQDKLKAAIQIIDDIEIPKLPKDTLLDYWTVKTAIALKTKDKKLAKEAMRNLKTLEISVPYYQKLKDSFIISLLDFLAGKETEKKNGKIILPSIMEGLRKLSEFLILEPNFYGIGVNLNKVIDKLGDEEKNRKQKGAD